MCDNTVIISDISIGYWYWLFCLGIGCRLSAYRPNILIGATLCNVQWLVLLGFCNLCILLTGVALIY